MSLALRGSAAVSIGEDKWCHKGPSIREEDNLAGADIDLHSWQFAGRTLEFCIRAVPAGHSPHNVRGSQAEQEVEDRVAVLSSSFSLSTACRGCRSSSSLAPSVTVSQEITFSLPDRVSLLTWLLLEVEMLEHNRQKTKTGSPIKFSVSRKCPLCDGGAEVGRD